MEAFIWDRRFETGIALVDSQHKELVGITNQLGDQLLQGALADDELQPLFHRLAEYARHHFNDEEQLMQANGIDPRHRDTHVAHHHQFVEQLLALWRSRASLANPAETVHGFLAAWLTVHILGEDQSMARQFTRLEQGQSAAEAFVADHQATDSATAILLDALGRLYSLLSEQNRNLLAINTTLEQRVDQRTADLAEANQQLLQSEKMAAIGQLAAGVAHEINNPIGFVNSNLGTMRTYVSHLLRLVDSYESGDQAAIAAARQAADLDFLRGDLPDLIAESQDGLSRVTKIVQDLKDFSHVDQAEQQYTDLNEAMEKTLNVVWNELKYKAEVIRELGDIPQVECVPAQINQVFMNLLVNAAQAIVDKGKITVRSGTSGENVWFEIEDSGKGMSEEIQKKIFEPFFTTKPVGQGTGLGLSISYDIIVKKHGGDISVRSTPGQGTCFHLRLPLKPPATLAASH